MRIAAVVCCVVALGAMGVIALGRPAVRAPTFTRTPPAVTASRTADFAYRIDLPRPRFRCALDGGRWRRCGTRARVVGLADGRHRFCVVVRRRSRIACHTWIVGPAAPRAFRMTASPVRPLLPGGDPVPVDIAFENLGPAPITVTGVTLTVDGACAVRVERGLAAAPEIPAGATRALSELGVPEARWPHLAMDDVGNQDACRGATIALTLTGSAQG